MFLDSVEAQFQFFVPVCLLKYYFFRLPSRLLFKSLQGLAFRECDFTDTDCVVLSIKVHALFILNGKLMLITLNKQTNATFVNLREAFICFVLCDTTLNLKVCFDGMALGLLLVDRPDL